MSSSCRSLEVERGGGGRVGEMVHLDPGSEPSHELRVRVEVRVRVRVRTFF